MKHKEQEKSLTAVNENSIFYRIKKFFRNLLYKTNNNTNKLIAITGTSTNSSIESNKNSFMETIKNIENGETKLLKLQKQYRSGEIKEGELTEEEVNSLCALYDKQIENLRNSNETRKQKLLEYRRNLQTDN